jgi:hypothetical protein
MTPYTPAERAVEATLSRCELSRFGLSTKMDRRTVGNHHHTVPYNSPLRLRPPLPCALLLTFHSRKQFDARMCKAQYQQDWANISIDRGQGEDRMWLLSFRMWPCGRRRCESMHDLMRYIMFLIYSHASSFASGTRSLSLAAPSWPVEPALPVDCDFASSTAPLSSSVTVVTCGLSPILARSTAATG